MVFFSIPAAMAPLVYGLLNIFSATGIVFANKTGRLCSKYHIMDHGNLSMFSDLEYYESYGYNG